MQIYTWAESHIVLVALAFVAIGLPIWFAKFELSWRIRSTKIYLVKTDGSRVLPDLVHFTDKPLGIGARYSKGRSGHIVQKRTYPLIEAGAIEVTEAQ